jgi:proteasome accessory factor B
VLTALADAIRDGLSVRFSYRTTSGETTERWVDPYSLVWRSGHYYLVGLDRERDDIRSFRVSRFVSQPQHADDASRPPRGFVGREHLMSGPWGPEDAEPVEVRVAFRERISWWATSGIQVAGLRSGADGWDIVTLPGSFDDRFVSWVLAFGPDARVLDPPALRQLVVDRLEATIGNL